MTPSAVLCVHDAERHPLGLDRNLGDHLLCSRNAVYRAIRQRTLALGARFIEDGPLYRDYMSFPLLCLQDLLQTRQLPYADNVSLFRRMAGSGRDPVVAPRLLREGLRRNYLLHESAHTVFTHSVASDPLPQLGNIPGTLLAAIGSEAYANVMEQLAYGCSDSAEQTLMLSLNVYPPHHPIGSRLLSEVIRIVSPQALLPYGFVCFFLANQWNYQVSASTINAIVELYDFGVANTTSAAFRNVLSRFTLNPAFVGETSVAYFSMHGLDEDFRKLSWKDFLQPGEHATWLREAALRASQMTALEERAAELVGDAA
jgi:hypothetical protein